MYGLKNILTISILVILVSGSCKNISRKDLSLTVKEYEAKGMPDINTPWPEDKLMKAHVALAGVRTKNFQQLPRRDSRKSGAVFNRILSKENLSFLDDPSKSLYDKAFEIQSIGPFINEIGRMYTDNFKQEQYYSEELIDIYVFEMYVRKRMLDLAVQIMDSRDPQVIPMQSGRTAIVRGYVNLIGFLIRQQDKTKSFSARQLKRLGSEVANSVKENMKYLDAENKKEISAEINQLAEKSKAGSISKDITNMLKALKE